MRGTRVGEKRKIGSETLQRRVKPLTDPSTKGLQKLSSSGGESRNDDVLPLEVLLLLLFSM